MTKQQALIKNNIKDEKRGSFYWIDEKPYISVTKILTVIDKPALRYWFGREVYYAMVAEPTLNESEALSAPYKKSEDAKERGSAVHSIVEAWKNIDEVVGKEGLYKNYAIAFQKWLNTTDVKIIDSEKTVVSENYRYAGTLDMIAEINGVKTIIDVKTGKDLYPEVHLQLSAYKEALGKDYETGALLLKEDGTFKYESGSNKLEAFLAAKTLYEGVNEEMLKKVGYLK